MTTSKTEKQYPIPAALPAILKGFARETLRVQPQDIYKFAAQYFKELHASSASQTQPGFVGDQAANLQATLLQHFLDADRSNIGLLHRDAVKQALCARGLALSSRQLQLALANSDEDPEGFIDYRSVAPHLSKLLLKSQEIDTQSNQPSLLRGQTGSETEAQFVQVFQQADSDLTGMISRQDFKICLQSHELALCRKDVNVLLGEVDDGPIEYQSLTESIYQVLATRLEDEMLLNEDLASSKALSQHLSIKDCLLQAFQESDQSGSGHLAKQKCVLVIKGLASNLLHLSQQESVALQSIVEGNASDKVAYDDFVGQCSRVIVQLEEEEYMFQYIQAHT
ncbi:hypothetical protein WJX82_006588 [Trebouxia sp. C0006]